MFLSIITSRAMLAGVRKCWSTTGKIPTTAGRGIWRLGRRFKSEFNPQHDDFPYRCLSYRDANHMSAEMESTTRLPLRSFFAQHRPLMPFGKPQTPDERQDTTKWVHVSTNNGRFPIFTNDERSMWNIIPEKIARQVGPFNRDAIIRTKWSDFKNNSNKETASPSSNNVHMYPAQLTATEMHSVLAKRFPILMEHLHKMAGTDGEVRLIPLSVEKIEDSEDSMEATSVRRKRKLKMNRHKYRKRLKEQRTKRRRLGK